MAKSPKELPEVYFDTRTRNRYLAKGLISQKDYEAFLASLPNDAENFELATFEDEDLAIESSASPDNA